MDKLSAEIAELKKEILNANEKRKALETTNAKFARVLEEKKATIDELSAESARLKTELPRVDEEREAYTIIDGLSAEIARLKAELSRVDEERKAYTTKDEHSARPSTNEENVIKSVEPILDQTDVEPEEIETTAKSDETTFHDTEISEAPPPTDETSRNPAGKWHVPLALAAVASFLLSLVRVF